jgi:hypothetical protein
MGRKCIRKLLLVMMEVLILILVQVHANVLAPSTFGPSSFPIPLPDFTELDQVLAPMGECLKNVIESCKEERNSHEEENPVADLIYDSCVVVRFGLCIKEYAHGLDLKKYSPFIICSLACREKHGVAGCLIKCYETHFENVKR